MVTVLLKRRSAIILAVLGLVSLNSLFAIPQKTLLFGTEATYPPFEGVSSTGKLQGFDLDVANAICDYLKIKCEFINQPFDSLMLSLDTGKINAIIAAMNIDSERAKSVTFTKAYYRSTASFISNKDVNFSLSAQGIKGKAIGVQQGSTLQQYLYAKYGNSITIKTYPSIQNAFMDVSTGRIDAVMGDTPIMRRWLVEYGKDKYHLLGSPVSDSLYFGAGYGIAVKKGDILLANRINDAINILQKNGTLNKIQKKYFVS